jgi:hypothetical protein
MANRLMSRIKGRITDVPFASLKKIFARERGSVNEVVISKDTV